MKIYVLPKYLIFITLYFLTEALTNKLHHSLNPEELGQIFNVNSHNEVPEYNIIRIPSRFKRSTKDQDHTRTVQINAFGEKRTLHLKPNFGLSRSVPVYFADTHDKGSGVKLTPISIDSDTGTPYQDEISKAAVMVHKDPNTGQLSFDGTIGDDLVVRPLPLSLHGLVPPTDAQSRTKEEEASENALPEDDELFTEEKDHEEDLVFSDGLPLVPDDEFVTGESVIPTVERKSKNETKEELPEGLLLLRRKRSPTIDGLHVIYKRKLPLVETDYAMLELDKMPLHTPATRSKRKKRDAPFVIYPEILVLVDYDGYLLHGQDNSKIKSYYVSFWNGVDLRYKLLSNPKVKISIAGIIISRSRDAMPYLERNRVGRDAIDSASALTDMGKYLYQERRLPTYDIAVAITKYDLCRRRKSGNCTTGTAGFAYVGGACVVNKRLQKVNSVAIVEDTGGFSGIIVAAHEVGHLLGAVHDGSPPPSYLGGPGARHCKWKDGFIMSDLRHTERGFRWSPCSVEQFHHFLNGETATCLYNLPHEDESLPRVLPGKLLTLDAQCRKDRGTTACFKDERVCAQLFCFDSSSGFCVSYRPAAEGSDCGNGKICLNGKCVYDNENTISDIDIHRLDDNYLYDSSLYSADTQSTSSTTTTTATTTTTTTTTQTPYTAHRRSGLWENNDIWKKDNYRNTQKPITNNHNQQNPISQWSPDPHYTSHSTTTTPFTTTSTSTTTTTTPYTTQRTTRELGINRYSNREKEEKQPYNSIKENDSNDVCIDLLPNETSNLSCQDFLRKYGSRYCNHRYIHKNCCMSQKELC